MVSDGLLKGIEQSERGMRPTMEHPPEKKPGPIEIPEPPNPREPAPWEPDRKPRIPERPADDG